MPTESLEKDILLRWERAVRSQLPRTQLVSSLALRDSLPQLINEVLRSVNLGTRLTTSLSEISRRHGHERAVLTHYSIEQVIHEYSLLREITLGALAERIDLSSSDQKLVRQAFDLGIMEATREFVRVKSLTEATESSEIHTAAARLHSLQMITEAALTHSSDIDRLLANIVRMVRELFQTDTVAVLLRGDDDASVVLRAAQGLDEEMQQGARVPVGQGFSGKIMESQRSIVVADLATSPLTTPVLLKRGIHSLMGAPLRVEDRALGVIHVGTLQPRQFDEEEAILLQLIADRVALAIDHARLYQQARKDNEELSHERDLRNRFVSALTHDLRNPITAACAGIQLLRRAFDKPEIRDRSLMRMEESLARADQMIEDLLDVNRIGAGREIVLDMQPIDAASLFREIAEELSTVLCHPIKVSGPESLSGYWCPKGLRRITENLLSNAIKYGSPDAPVLLHLTKDQTRLRLSVHNEGEPIPPAEQEKLFEAFQRSRTAEASGKKGWGIGLALVRGLASAHGGTVTVDSGPDRGTTFTVDLPMDARPHA